MPRLPSSRQVLGVRRASAADPIQRPEAEKPDVRRDVTGSHRFEPHQVRRQVFLVAVGKDRDHDGIEAGAPLVALVVMRAKVALVVTPAKAVVVAMRAMPVRCCCP